MNHDAEQNSRSGASDAGDDTIGEDVNRVHGDDNDQLSQSNLEILITLPPAPGNASSRCPDLAPLRSAIELICEDRGFHTGEISVSIVGHDAMRKLHREYLGHDETTDVIAFPLACDPPMLAADLAICLDVACEQAIELGVSVESELLLYGIHAMLHVTGDDDTTEIAFQEMRESERRYMAKFGHELRHRDRSAHPEEDGS